MNKCNEKYSLVTSLICILNYWMHLWLAFSSHGGLVGSPVCEMGDAVTIRPLLFAINFHAYCIQLLNQADAKVNVLDNLYGDYR